MKNTMQILIGVLAFGLLTTTTGCVTSGNPSGVVSVGSVTLDPVATGHAVQVAAKLGGIAAIQQKPNIRPYFLDASVAITAALAAGNVTPDDIRATLGTVTSDSLALAATTDAIQLYADFYGSLVKNKLDGRSPYTVPVLIGLAAGCKQAYDATGTP